MCVFDEVIDITEEITIESFDDKEEGGHRNGIGHVICDFVTKKKYFDHDYLNRRTDAFNIDGATGVNVPPSISVNVLET